MSDLLSSTLPEKLEGVRLTRLQLVLNEVRYQECMGHRGNRHVLRKEAEGRGLVDGVTAERQDLYGHGGPLDQVRVGV